MDNEADVVVLLRVKTKEPLKQETIDQFCDFGQKEEQDEKDITNEQFQTGVKAGNKIRWMGVPSDDTFDNVFINIQKIQYSGEKNIFGKPFILGNPYATDDGELDPIIGNVVDGIVPSDVGEESEEYTMFFTVSNQKGIFSIDPTIKVSPVN